MTALTRLVIFRSVLCIPGTCSHHSQICFIQRWEEVRPIEVKGKLRPKLVKNIANMLSTAFAINVIFPRNDDRNISDKGEM